MCMPRIKGRYYSNCLNSTNHLSHNSGLVPLHNACSYGHYEVAELLLEVVCVCMRACVRASHFPPPYSTVQVSMLLTYGSTHLYMKLHLSHGELYLVVCKTVNIVLCDYCLLNLFLLSLIEIFVLFYFLI